MSTDPAAVVTLLVAPVAVEGGVGVVLEALASHADVGGYKAHVLFLRDGPVVDRVRRLGVPVHVLDAGRTRSVASTARAVRAAAGVVRSVRPEVVVCTEPSAQLYVALVCSQERIPVVVQHHAAPARDAVEIAGRLLPTQVTLANSEYVASLLRPSRPAGTIEVLHPGVDVPAFAEANGEHLRRSLGITHGQPLIGIVGRLQAWKGQHLFLEAAARVRVAHPDARFAVVGGAEMGWEDPTYPEWLRDRAERDDLAGTVVFSGQVSETTTWTAACDVVVSASDAEPYGLAICEAQAAGKPVVACDSGGPREIITDDIDGILVDRHADAIASALLALLDDDVRATRLGRRAAATAEARHSNHRMASEFGEILARTARRTARHVMFVAPVAVEGGAGENLLTLLRRADPAKYLPSVVFLADGPLRRRVHEAGVPSVLIDAGRLRSPSAFLATVRKLHRQIRATRPDVVMSMEPKAHLYAGTAAKLSHTPTIWRQPGRPSRRDALQRVIAKVPAERVVVASDFVARLQRSLGKTPVQIIVPGVDRSRLQCRGGAELRAQHGIRPQDVLIGIVGRLEAWKGQDLFLRAAARIAGERPEARFVVVGGAEMGWEKGDYPAELRRLATELELDDVLTFTGQTRDVATWFDAMDVVVHASREEPFGMVLPEAMLAGCAVVTVPEGGPLEIVRDGVTGLLAEQRSDTEIAQAVLRYLEDPGLRDRLAEAARREAHERFTSERMVGEFASVFDEVAR